MNICSMCAFADVTPDGIVCTATDRQGCLRIHPTVSDIILSEQDHCDRNAEAFRRNEGDLNSLNLKGARHE